VWADIVAHPVAIEYSKHLAAGTGIDIAMGINATDPKRISTYVYKHSDVGGKSKDYQHDPPKEWLETGGTGRFWGYTGLHKLVVEHELTDSEFIRLRRELRKLSRSQGNRPRGRQSMTREVIDPRTGEITYRVVKVRRDSFCRTARLYGGFHLSSDGEHLGASMLRALDAQKIGGLASAKSDAGSPRGATES
jgi:hypothetical protein